MVSFRDGDSRPEDSGGDPGGEVGRSVGSVIASVVRRRRQRSYWGSSCEGWWVGEGGKRDKPQCEVEYEGIGVARYDGRNATLLDPSNCARNEAKRVGGLPFLGTRPTTLTPRDRTKRRSFVCTQSWCTNKRQSTVSVIPELHLSHSKWPGNLG